MKTVFILSGVLVVVDLLVVVAVYLFQDRLLFFPRPVLPSYRQALAEHAIRFQHDGVELHGRCPG